MTQSETGGYLVDLGQLVHVLAVTPKDAYQLALLAQGNEISRHDFPVCVYRLSETGEPLEVVAA